MARYDIENLLTDIKAMLIADLNTAIDAVEAEKIAQGLPITGLEHVDPAVGYFQQSWSDAILNVSPAIFFGMEESTAEGAGPATKQLLKVFVEIVMVDSGMDALGNTRILRYTRAIMDVLQANYDQIPSASKIKIETVRPISFKLDQDSSNEMKVGGVSLTTALA